MTNSTRKPTKRDMYALIKTLCADNAQVVAFCDHEVELLDGKTAASKTHLSANQKANEDIKARLVALLVKPMTVSDILKVDGFEQYTNQKVSALLRQLVLAGLVARVEDKRKTYFKAV